MTYETEVRLDNEEGDVRTYLVGYTFSYEPRTGEFFDAEILYMKYGDGVSYPVETLSKSMYEYLIDECMDSHFQDTRTGWCGERKMVKR